MTRPRLLDLFCGAGGAGMGYHRAGFDVVGVDISPQPHYPFEFHQGDAMTWPLDGFDAIHASPPCHAHSALRHRRPGSGVDTGWMLPATIERLAGQPRPWIVENVEQAEMGPAWSTICGTALGLRVDTATGGERWLKRHRRFASSHLLMVAPCACSRARKVIGVYGHGGGGAKRGWKGYQADAVAAMGIDWMNRAELVLAIPPVYAELLGRQILDALTAAA